MIWRLIVGLGLFAGSLLAGWWLGKRGLVTDSVANRLIRFVVKRLSPVVLCLSFWRLTITAGSQWALPLIGCLLSLAALLPGWLYARFANLTRPQIGSFLTCAMFSNLGFLGAFIAFAVFGELAYGLAMWYLVFFSPCFYSVGLTIAKRYGTGTNPGGSESPFSDELRLPPFLGLLAGLGLSLLRVPRHPAFEVVNHVLIPVDTVLYLIAIGSQLRLESLGRSLKPCLAMSAIKFGFCPLIGLALVSVWHLEGLPRFVVLLQASMPVAISPLMLTVLCGLDRRLSSTLWAFTTLLAIPWLLIYVPLIR